MLLDKDADDPWDPDRLAWPLLDVIDSVMGEPGFADLTTPPRRRRPGDDELRRPALRRGPAAGRPVRLVRHAAAELITDWREGRDTDGAGGELEVDLRWQAELWRRLVAG